MSWMDSWSRPGKRAAVPPPLYVTHGEEVLYCRTCGRVMSSSKKRKQHTQGIKYCSDRCRQQKPGPTDAKIESLILALLEGEEDSGIDKTDSAARKVKGDKRNIVTCGEIEELFFGSHHDPAKVFGRRKNRASRAISEPPTEGDYGRSLPEDEQEEPSTDNTRPLVRPPQSHSDVNGSIGGEKGRAERTDETTEQASKRREGQQRADQLEMVRRAARRAVVFGFETNLDTASAASQQHGSKGQKPATVSSDANRRKCEALMKGSVVEPSYAKGDWAIRWRE